VSNIPSHWRLCKLGDVIRLRNGFAFKSSDYSDDGIPLIRISDIGDGKVTTEAAVRIPREKAKLEFKIDPGDLLIAMSGATTGKTGVYEGRETVLQNQRIGNFKILDDDVVDKKYRNYYVASLRKEIERAAYGGAQPNISAKDIESFTFPLAPLSEQKGIVAEIEKQFSRLDEAVANLKRVKANLKRYKTAVLKAAVEGKLTEDWRKAHPDVEPASELLKRILVERRAKWNGKGKYKEPAAPDATNLPRVPEKWTWTSLDQLLCVLRNGISIKPDAESGLRILQISALRPLAVNLEDIRFLSANTEEFADYVLNPGDLLFTRYNGNPSLVGVCAGVPHIKEKTVHPDKLIRGVLASTLSLPMFVAIMANVGVSRDYLARRVRTTAGQSGISGGDLRTMPIPVAPLAEQEWLVAEVERRLSMIEQLNTVTGTNLRRAERLRQAVLAMAFSGRLRIQRKEAHDGRPPRGNDR
jgi:type I restriction enzyme, S subunit